MKEKTRDLTAAFSGHRSFKMADTDDLFIAATNYSPEDIILKVSSIVKDLYREGFRYFLCGMAEGFDLLAAEAVLRLKKELPALRLVAVIPYPGQAAAFDEETRRLYDKVLAGADDAITVCDRYSPDCFHRRNDYLVDNSSALICFYNGKKGGTAYTVKRAL